jgi:hypothetical protein
LEVRRPERGENDGKYNEEEKERGVQCMKKG